MKSIIKRINVTLTIIIFVVLVLIVLAFCNIPENKDWVDILAAFLAPFVAVFVGIIAYYQFKIAREKLKHDLFERRMKIFNEIGMFMAKIMQDGTSNYNDSMNLLRSTKEAVFLFDDKIDKYIREDIYKKSTRLTFLRTMQDKPGNKGLEENLREHEAILNWFDVELRNIQDKFKEYLRIYF
jgi:hypothetical protein